MSATLIPSRPPEATTPARGVVYIHACPRALSPHVDWGLARVLDQEIKINWTAQPIASGYVRGELSWQSIAGTAGLIAKLLMDYSNLRFEVTEEATPGRDGERIAVTPGLGPFRATIGMHGDIMVPEDRLRTMLAGDEGEEGPLGDRLRDLLGTDWDEELEPFRYAGDGADVRWLHKVG